MSGVEGNVRRFQLNGIDEYLAGKKPTLLMNPTEGIDESADACIGSSDQPYPVFDASECRQAEMLIRSGRSGEPCVVGNSHYEIDIPSNEFSTETRKNYLKTDQDTKVALRQVKNHVFLAGGNIPDTG